MSMILVACTWSSVLCYGKIVKHASPGKLTLNQALAVALILTNPHSLPQQYDPGNTPTTGRPHKHNEAFRVAIGECLRLSPTDCSQGPHGPIWVWDVSAVTDMSGLFMDSASNIVPGADKFNGDLSNWDVSRVADMGAMFYSASSFNADLSKWDVSRVTFMSGMFRNATSFNADLSKWDVFNVTDMSAMFWTATSFNSDLS